MSHSVNGSNLESQRRKNMDEIATNFQNKSDVKVTTWEVIQKEAKKVFNYFTYGKDLDWAESAWRFIEKTHLSNYSSDSEFYRVIIRLFALGELFYIYMELAFHERYERNEKYVQWVDELELSRIEIVLLAGDDYRDDSFIVEFEAIAEPVDELIKIEYDRVINTLIEGFGSEDDLLISLEKAASNWDEESIMAWEEAIERGYYPAEAIIYPESLKLFEWKESGFTRDEI